MDHQIKILELLEKKNLTNQEINELEKLAAEDKDLKDFILTYKRIGGIVKQSSHLTEEEISEYILYKNEIPGENNQIIKRIPFIESHLRDCQRCSEIYKELNSEYSDLDTFITENRVLQEPAEEEQKSSRIISSKNRTPKYAFASVLLVGLIYLSLFLISNFNTPSFYKNAAISNQTEISVNRGRATENFQKSIKALENNNYDKAISFLKEDIKLHPNDETTFYSYYILGLSFLKTAEHDYLGLFLGYDKERAAEGKKYLEQSVVKNNSGKFINIKLNSYFYLAKASIMLDDKESAKKYLSMVINEKGSKMDEAEKLLGEME